MTYRLHPAAAMAAELLQMCNIPLNDKEKYHMSIYAVECALINGYANCTISLSDLSLKYFCGCKGFVTQKEVLDAYAYYTENPPVFDAHNFYSSPITLTDEDIIAVKKAGHEKHMAKLKIYAEMSECEWVDAFGFTKTELEELRYTRLSTLKGNDLHTVSTRKQTAIAYVIGCVHIGMASIPESHYDFDDMCQHAIDNTLYASDWQEVL